MGKIKNKSTTWERNHDVELTSLANTPLSRELAKLMTG